MKKRYYDVDLARCLCILTLPMIHIYEYWGSWAGMADLLQSSVSRSLSGLESFLTIFVAQAFMVCMGMNMVWTRSGTAKAFAKRGVALLVTELMLNLVRYVLPGLIGVAIGGTDTPEAVTALWWMIQGLINSDILAFAGLAFLVFALFRQLRLRPHTIVIISALCLVLNEVIAVTAADRLNSTCNYFFCELLANFFYLSADSTFPLLGWLIFPACGFWMASALQSGDENKQRRVWLYTGIGSAVCLAAVVLYMVLTGLNPLLRLNAAECGRRMDILCLSGDLSAALLFICLCHALYGLLHLEKKPAFNRLVRAYSAGITVNYMIQWTIVGWGLFITCGTRLWGCESLGPAETLLSYVLIELASFFGSRWWLRRKSVPATERRESR